MRAAFNNPERAVEYLMDPSSMPAQDAAPPAANPAAAVPANPAADIPANPGAAINKAVQDMHVELNMRIVSSLAPERRKKN